MLISAGASSGTRSEVVLPFGAPSHPAGNVPVIQLFSFENWALLARGDDSVATSEYPAIECWSSGVLPGKEGERKSSDGGALEHGYRGV